MCLELANKTNTAIVFYANFYLWRFGWWMVLMAESTALWSFPISFFSSLLLVAMHALSAYTTVTTVAACF